MHHPHNDGLGVRDAKVNIVTAVGRQSKSRPDAIARYPAVTQPRDTLQSSIELGYESARRLRIAYLRETIVTRIEIAPGAIGDVQAFLFNGASPRAMMSSVNSSALA